MSDCYECKGTGECASCHGVGLGLISKCVICGGTGACQNCNPRGYVATRITSTGTDLRRILRVIAFIISPIIVLMWALYRTYLIRLFGH